MDNKTVSENIKLQAIGLDGSFTGTSDEQIEKIKKIDGLDILQKSLNTNNSQQNSNKMIDKTNKSHHLHVKNPIKNKIDKGSDKYKITLEFLNAIVVTIGRPAINDITEFKDILRSDLMKPDCQNILNEYIERIIKVFGKSPIRYNMRLKYKCYFLTVIKYLSSLCGYRFQSKNDYKSSKKDNVSISTLNTYYSICD